MEVLVSGFESKEKTTLLRSPGAVGRAGLTVLFHWFCLLQLAFVNLTSHTRLPPSSPSDAVIGATVSVFPQKCHEVSTYCYFC